VCARGGGLVLRARPEPETLNRASPCPSAWTAGGVGAQAFGSASAFNANIGAWNTASVSNMAVVCAASPARLHRRARARACDWRGPPMRPSLSRARVGTSAGHIANALVMYEYIYIHIYRCKVRACKWVCVYVLAYACNRVRALTTRYYAAHALSS
jgi:hypothetical protein